MNITRIITWVFVWFAIITKSAKPSSNSGSAETADCRTIDDNEITFKMTSIDFMEYTTFKGSSDSSSSEDRNSTFSKRNSTFCYEICLDFNPFTFYPVDCLHRNRYTLHQWLLQLPECCQNSDDIVSAVNDNKDMITISGDLETSDFEIEHDFLNQIFGFRFSNADINQFELNECLSFCIDFDYLITSFPDIEWDIIQKSFGAYSLRSGMNHYSDDILGIDLCGCYDTEDPTTAPSDAPTAPPTAVPTIPTNRPTEAPSPAPTESPTDIPTASPTAAPIAYGCEFITSCIQCAVHAKCVWCDDGCYNEDVSGDIVCDDDDIQDTEALCPGYNPVANAGWDDGEKLCYDMIINSCEYTETESTNTTDCEKKVQQTFHACFWIMNRNEQQPYTYQVLGKLVSIVVDSESLLNANQTSWIPPCYLEIRGGIVRNITCANIPNARLLEVGETELNIGDYYVKKQNDVLLSFIRFLLPRLEASLFYPDLAVIEQDAAGFHAITRVHDHDNGTNQTHVHMAYGLEDVVEWDTGFMPNGLVFSQDVFINDNNSHVTRVAFFERLSFDLNGNGVANAIIDMDFALVSEAYTTEQEVNHWLDLLDEFPNGTVTFKFTAQMWRLHKYTRDEMEFETANFTKDEDVDITITRRRLKVENPNEGQRRRLSPFPFDLDDILPPGDINEWMDFEPEDMYRDRMRDMLGADARVTVISHEHSFIKEVLLGFPVELKYVIKGGLHSKAGKLWWNVFNMPQWPALTGCTNKQGEIVVAKADTPALYHECCNQQKRDYANCDLFKQDADANAYACYQNADALDGGVYNIADELMAFLTEDYWGNQRYIAAKYRNCDIWGELGATLYLTVGWVLQVGRYNIFLKGVNIQQIPMDPKSGTLQPAYVKELGRQDMCFPIGNLPIAICGGLSVNIIMYTEYSYESELAYERWQVVHGFGLSITTEVYLDLWIVQIGIFMDGLMLDYSVPFRIALDRIDRNIISYVDWDQHEWTQRFGLFYRVRNWDLSMGNRVDQVSEVRKGREVDSFNLYQWSLKPYCESLCFIWIYEIDIELDILFLDELRIAEDLIHLRDVFGEVEDVLFLIESASKVKKAAEIPGKAAKFWNDHGDKVVNVISWIANIFYALRRRNLLQSSQCDEDWALSMEHNSNNLENGYLCYDVCLLPARWGETPNACSKNARETQWTFNIPECCSASDAIPTIVTSPELETLTMSLDEINSQWLFETEIHYDECGWFCIAIDELGWSHSQNGEYQDVTNADAAAPVTDFVIPDPCDCDHTDAPSVQPTAAPSRSPIWGGSLPPQIRMKVQFRTGYPWQFVHIRNMVTNKDNLFAKNFIDVMGLADKGWTVDDLQISLRSAHVTTLATYTPPTEPPTSSPTNAPTNAPSLAPSNAPSLSPTFCDHDIADWTVEFAVRQMPNVGIELHSSCDERKLLDYLLKFMFVEIVEMENEAETKNRMRVNSLFKNEMDWNYKYGVFNEYIPYMEIYGHSHLKFAGRPDTDTVFSMSFFVFYHKFLSELENGISVAFNITNWPFLSENNTLKMEWEIIATSTEYAKERVLLIKQALFAKKLNLDSGSEDGPFNKVLLSLEHAEFERGGSNAMSPYEAVNDRYIIQLVSSLFYVVLDTEDDTDTYTIEVNPHYFYNNSVTLDFYMRGNEENENAFVYDGLSNLKDWDETYFTSQWQSAKQQRPLVDVISPDTATTLVSDTLNHYSYYLVPLLVVMAVLAFCGAILISRNKNIWHQHVQLKAVDHDASDTSDGTDSEMENCIEY